MNVRTFLKEFEQSVNRDALVDAVYDEMVEFCDEENITTDEISTPTLERVAEGFVERGLGVPPSDETVFAKGKYQSDEFIGAVEEFQELNEELLEELKRLHKEDANG